MKLLTSAAAATAAIACLALTVPGPANAGGSTADTPIPACANSNLKVTQKYDGSGAGHRFAKIRIKNISDHACRTGGYGGVSYVGDGDGTQIGHAAIRERKAAARSFILRPGRRLVSNLDMVNAEIYSNRRCHRADVDGLRVYVPNATESQFVPLPTVGCRRAKVHLLFQQPYHRPGS